MLDAPVTYNGIELNTIEEMGNGIRRGCIIEEFDYGFSRGIGYTEKRAQDDGLDASDVYQGPRTINLSGVVYGDTLADLFDRLQTLRAALTPTIAYNADKDDYGYIPLEFSLPTNNTAFGGAKELEYRCRPTGQPQFSIRRDAGAFANRTAMELGAGIAWQATLECKDPRMYVRPDTWVPFTTSKTGQPIVNRGDYPAPLDILLGITTSPASSRFELDVGGSTVKITTNGMSNAVVRYSGELKVLTVDTGGTDVLRMDLLDLGTAQTHPKVLAKPNQTYTIRLIGSPGWLLAAGTRLMYSESFA